MAGNGSPEVEGGGRMEIPRSESSKGLRVLWHSIYYGPTTVRQ